MKYTEMQKSNISLQQKCVLFGRRLCTHSQHMVCADNLSHMSQHGTDVPYLRAFCEWCKMFWIQLYVNFLPLLMCVCESTTMLHAVYWVKMCYVCSCRFDCRSVCDDNVVKDVCQGWRWLHQMDVSCVWYAVYVYHCACCDDDAILSLSFKPVLSLFCFRLIQLFLLAVYLTSSAHLTKEVFRDWASNTLTHTPCQALGF